MYLFLPPSLTHTHARTHAHTRTIYKGMHAEGKLVSPDTSADKLAALITKDAYDNGAHVDFYDL